MTARETIPGIEFARLPQCPLYMDIHRPVTASPPAVVVWLHGGGWMQGRRDWNVPFIALEQGFALASIDYRLTDVATWPAQLDDCEAAVRFLHRRGAEFGLDPRRIVVWGKSAGGHLAAMLTLRSNVAVNSDLETHVRAGVDYCGPTDLTGYTSPDIRSRFGILIEITEKLLGGPIATRMDLARHASPVTYAHRDAAPLLIAHGDNDGEVPVSDSIQLDARLRAAGANVTLSVLAGVGHKVSSVETDTKAMEFLRRAIGDEPRQTIR